MLTVQALVYVMALAWLTFPPRFILQEVTGRQLPLAEIKSLPPTCVKVALVGAISVGKTTFLEHLAALPQTYAHP